MREFVDAYDSAYHTNCGDDEPSVVSVPIEPHDGAVDPDRPVWITV